MKKLILAVFAILALGAPVAFAADHGGHGGGHEMGHGDHQGDVAHDKTRSAKFWHTVK